jgi:hypothetical protein
VIAPEFFYDSINGGVSMNPEATLFYKLTGKVQGLQQKC